MGMNVIERHFKDEADRNHKAARDAHYEIGWLRAGERHAKKEAAHFKAQYNTAFQSLQTARNDIYRLASEIADTLGSESSASEQVDAIADKIEKQFDELSSRTYSII